jgi:hypothetical protein
MAEFRVKMILANWDIVVLALLVARIDIFSNSTL